MKRKSAYLLLAPLFLLLSFSKTDRTVYICDSSTSYAYHLNQNCRGLNRCTHVIKATTESEAKKTRKFCGWED